MRSAVRELVDNGAEAIVVSLTNATENPEHELRIQEIILEEYPAHVLGAIPVLLGHQVSGRKGEYVRATSTIVDGFLHEIMFHALGTAREQPARLRLRQADAGHPQLRRHGADELHRCAADHPLRTDRRVSARPSTCPARPALGNVVSTDMGGTSFDIGLVPEGGVKHYDFQPDDRPLAGVACRWCTC